MNILVKQQAACSSLNMQFDEASQLSGAETMGSMQMAKVNGGEPITLATVLSAAGIVLSVAGIGLTIYYATTTNTPSPNSLTVVMPGVGELKIPSGVTADSIRFSTGSGMDAKTITIYGPSTAPSNTPSPIH